jgi:hypothetical protein
MDWVVAFAGVLTLGFIGWELAETWRLNARAKRHRERQNAATDRGENS